MFKFLKSLFKVDNKHTSDIPRVTINFEIGSCPSKLPKYISETDIIMGNFSEEEICAIETKEELEVSDYNMIGTGFYRHQNKPELGLKFFDKAIVKDPTYGSAYGNAISASILLNNSELIKSYYREGLANAVRDRDHIYYQYGRWLVNNQEFMEAGEIAQKGLLDDKISGKLKDHPEYDCLFVLGTQSVIFAANQINQIFPSHQEAKDLIQSAANFLNVGLQVYPDSTDLQELKKKYFE